MNIQDNAEYCTGQTFTVIFTTGNNRIWQCSQCAYQLLQSLTETGLPAIPAYHPKPIPTSFTVIDEQGLYKQVVSDTIKQQIERREKRLDTLKSTYPRDLETIGKVEHGIMTLLELEHILHLCDCPEEAFTNDENHP